MVLSEIEPRPNDPANGAAAEGAARGRANADAILRHLREHGPTSAPQIGTAVGLSEVNTRGHLRRMASDGLVVKAGTRWSLTPPGIGRIGGSATPGDFDAVCDLLPAEPYRAAFRLMHDAVVMRWHHAERLTGWPAFAFYGAEGSFKSALCRVLGRMLGMADEDHLLVVSDRGRADLLGRRVPDGKGGYRWTPAPVLAGPLVSLDEMDKATGDARTHALRLVQGDSVLTIEGEHHTMRATVVLTLNSGADPRSVLPPDRLRRCVILHTTDLADDRAILTSAEVLLDRTLPVLDLGRLQPLAEVPPQASAVLHELPDHLTIRATSVPLRELATLVCGRMAFCELDAEVAAVDVAMDYLTTAETWGGTTERHVAAFCRRIGIDVPEPSVPELAEVLDADERSDAVTLAEHRAEGEQAVKDALAFLRGATDPEGVRLRGAFTEVGKQVKDAKTLAELRSVAGIFDRLDERAERRQAQIEGVRAMTGERPRRQRSGRAVAPDRFAMLLQLRAAGHRDPPGPMLARLGLVEEVPLAPGDARFYGHRRWRSVLPGCGATVFDDDSWTDLSAQGVLAAAIEAEQAAQPASTDLTLYTG